MGEARSLGTRTNRGDPYATPSGAYTRTETLAMTTKTAPIGAIGRDDEVATVQAFLDGVSSRPAALCSTEK